MYHQLKATASDILLHFKGKYIFKISFNLKQNSISFKNKYIFQFYQTFKLVARSILQENKTLSYFEYLHNDKVAI